MKKLIFSVTYLVLFSLIFYSCSKDETNPDDGINQEKAILSFGALLNNLGNSSAFKQAIADIPVCSDEAANYVMIILSRGGTNIVGSQGDPFRINLVAGQSFTEEVPELELEPGNYSLDHFAVFDAMGNVLWVAPVEGSELANFVNSPLPLAISLGAGVKKYIDVPVLCFDDRMLNEYGYVLSDLLCIPGIEFCIFGNYCDDTGRHYPAEFSVNIWNYVDGQKGVPYYTNVTNSVELNDDGDYAGTPVCVGLPDTEGLTEYYIEITLLNSDAYGTITERVIREGVITDEDVKSLFSGENAVDYFHFREGCSGEDTPDLFASTFFGPALSFGEGTAKTMITLDSGGKIKDIGIVFSEDLLEGLPQQAEEISLQLPEEGSGSIFDHIDLGWNPEGHEPPGVYDIPHFDIHFYMITQEYKMQITDADLAEIIPGPEFLPDTYIPTPGFVPMMGKHWVSLEAGEMVGDGFSQTFIYGSYDGQFIFYEPMITLDYLNDKTRMQYEIHQPADFQRTGYHPTTYSINYDAAKMEYTVSLGGMVWR